jgi:tetratricopeptide (TPR) repeat protein
MTVAVAAQVCLVFTPVLAFQATPPGLDLARLLDDYAAGRFDQAVRAFEAAGDLKANQLRSHWRGTVRLWVDANPASKPRRLLATASFALETEHLRAERGGWNYMMTGVCQLPPNARNRDARGPAGQCVMEWAWSLLGERALADEGERAWVLAAAALLSGMREYAPLYRFLPRAVPPDPTSNGLLREALRRHPDDKRLQLEQAIAAAARYNITVDGGGSAPAQFTTIVNIGGVRTTANVPPRDDAEVGPEARMRLGYLLWEGGDRDRSRKELAAAAKAAKDPELRYLAHFLRGWIAMTSNNFEEALPDMEAALAARPDSQSAALALSALELQRGEAARAETITARSLTNRPDDADPWRLFLYGHHPRLPLLIAELRKQVLQ